VGSRNRIKASPVVALCGEVNHERWPVGHTQNALPPAQPLLSALFMQMSPRRAPCLPFLSLRSDRRVSAQSSLSIIPSPQQAVLEKHVYRKEANITQDTALLTHQSDYFTIVTLSSKLWSTRQHSVTINRKPRQIAVIKGAFQITIRFLGISLGNVNAFFLHKWQ